MRAQKLFRVCELLFTAIQRRTLSGYETIRLFKRPWYSSENHRNIQGEEEAMFNTHIDYLKRIIEDQNALLLYEKELGKREFSPEED